MEYLKEYLSVINSGIVITFCNNKELNRFFDKDIGRRRLKYQNSIFKKFMTFVNKDEGIELSINAYGQDKFNLISITVDNLQHHVYIVVTQHFGINNKENNKPRLELKQNDYIIEGEFFRNETDEINILNKLMQPVQFNMLSGDTYYLYNWYHYPTSKRLYHHLVRELPNISDLFIEDKMMLDILESQLAKIKIMMKKMTIL